MKKRFSLLMMVGLVLSVASPAFAAEQKVPAAKPDTNVAVLLDASGSMAKRIDGVSKFNLAKKEIFQFAKSLPTDSQVKMSVFGSEGNNKNSGKVQSCEAIRNVYGFQGFDEQSFRNSLNTIGPTGWTPIAKALNEAKSSFDQLDKKGENVVYLLTDGEETCGGNPIKTAKELHKHNITVNVIGFDFKEGYKGQLNAIAKVGGGEYFPASNQSDIKQIFKAESIKLAK
ncbi:vWA domain-containing protein [Bacillus atrophaeus]|uniref:vWA domain-containing protein n=1 Tax=Bacillus atrophaeus TaxID=1452 RepID=UPI003D2248F9